MTNKKIKQILKQNRPKHVDAKYVFTTDWRPSEVNEGSYYREAVFVLDDAEFRVYIDKDMRNYDKWETWIQLAEPGVWYTVRILYEAQGPIIKSNRIRLHGDGIPKRNQKILPNPKDILFNF